MRSLLIDTNIVSAYFAGDRDLPILFGSAETVWVSAIVIGELEAGFPGGNRYRENLSILERFLGKPTVQVLPVTRETASVHGMVKKGLRDAGTPLPGNDVWIASQALEIGAVLATRDGHFKSVAGLRLWAGVE